MEQKLRQKQEAEGDEGGETEGAEELKHKPRQKVPDYGLVYHPKRLPSKDDDVLRQSMMPAKMRKAFVYRFAKSHTILGVRPVPGDLRSTLISMVYLLNMPKEEVPAAVEQEEM